MLLTLSMPLTPDAMSRQIDRCLYGHAAEYATSRLTPLPFTPPLPLMLMPPPRAAMLILMPDYAMLTTLRLLLPL